MNINGKMKRHNGFGTIIAKTRGACVIARVDLWAESKLGLRQEVKKACKSVPTWAFGPHWPCILRFSSRLEIESDRDKIRIRLFPKSLDYKYVSYVIHKEERHRVSQTTTLGASPPLILGFHPSKRHAALIVFLQSGQHCSCLYLGITRTEAFLMASNASYPDVRSMAF